MGSEAYTICPHCLENVDPADESLVYAVEILNDTMGGANYVDGMGGYFHAECYPHALGWSPRPRPQDGSILNG
jgi:hypothetical protein